MILKEESYTISSGLISEIIDAMNPISANNITHDQLEKEGGEIVDKIHFEINLQERKKDILVGQYCSMMYRGQEVQMMHPRARIEIIDGVFYCYEKS